MPKTKCDHSAWVQVVHARAERKLIYDNKLQSLTADLQSADAQWPSIALFLGNRTKSEAIRTLFPHTSFHSRRRNDSVFHLRSEKTSTGSKYPLYLGEADPNIASCGLELGKTRCHTQLVLPVAWQSPARFVDLVLARLVFPFANVLCIFASDCGGYEGVCNLLTEWALLAEGNHYPYAARPRVLVVSHDSDEIFANAIGVDGLKHDINQRADSDRAYASVQVLQIPSQSSTDKPRYLKVKNALLNALDRSRADRITNSLHFNAEQQAALFKRSAVHFAQTIREPFNYIQEARYGMEVDAQLVHHIEHVGRLARQAKIPDAIFLSLTASSILMDTQPPSMHGKYALPRVGIVLIFCSLRPSPIVPDTV